MNHRMVLPYFGRVENDFFEILSSRDPCVIRFSTARETGEEREKLKVRHYP